MWILSHGFLVSWTCSHTTFSKMHVSAVQIIDKNVFKFDKNLCYYNYKLRMGFRPLLMSNSWKKSCTVSLSTRDPQFTVVRWCMTATILWLFASVSLRQKFGNMELIMTALDIGETPLDLWLLCMNSGMLNLSHIGNTRSNQPLLLFLYFYY